MLNNYENNQKIQISDKQKAILKSAIVIASGLALNWVNQLHRKATEHNCEDSTDVYG